MNEFDIIKHYFTKPTTSSDVLLSIGDDCALVKPPLNQAIAMTTDTLVSGVHFFKEAAPADIGYHAMAVNLSDLAAIGATPAWVMLSLTLPEANDAWLADFCKGFFALTQQYPVQLIGGDLTRGPLSISVSAYGFVPPEAALKRNGAKIGDLIYVSGYLGDAGYALEQHRYHAPQPRVELGQALRGLAHAAIDISDGLVADLNHILTASNVGAVLFVDQLPLSASLREAVDIEKAYSLALTAGDDYELCFTIPAHAKASLEAYASTLSYPLHWVGEITATNTLELKRSDGKELTGDYHGYQHF